MQNNTTTEKTCSTTSQDTVLNTPDDLQSIQCTSKVRERHEFYRQDQIVRDDDATIDNFATGVRTGLERSLGWKGAAFNLLAYSVAVGVFTLPRAAAVLGLVPFILLIFIFQYMTWFTGMAYARLQQQYPGIRGVPDAAHLLYGDTGRAIMTFFQLLFSVMLSGNHIILGSYAFYSLGWKSCAVLLNFTFMAISFLFTLPRSYTLFSRLAFVSALSIFSSMVFVMVVSSIGGPDHLKEGLQAGMPKAFGSASKDDRSFIVVVMAIANLFFSFGAHPCFFPLMGEMRYPEHFPRALLSLIIAQTCMYIALVAVVLHGAGTHVASPVVASLSPQMQRVSYAIALPAIVISGCSSGQVSAKQVYAFALRRISFIRKSLPLTWLTWIFINTVIWTAAWIMAELVPFFGSFMAIESSVIWVIYLSMGCTFYFFLNKNKMWKSPEMIWQTLCSSFIIVFCICLALGGLYSAILSIIDSYQNGVVSRPFSCQIPSA